MHVILSGVHHTVVINGGPGGGQGLASRSFFFTPSKVRVPSRVASSEMHGMQ